MEEALELVLEHSRILYPETRSNLGISTSDALALTKDRLAIDTRSGAAVDIPDTTFYIFNFPDNAGYAVASANRRYGNTLFCITESGSLSLDDFSSAQTRAADDSTGNDNGTEFIIDLLTASTMAQEVVPPDSIIGGGAPCGIIGPLLKTKWTQEIAPFNDLTPNNYPAGCVVIAVAQIMAYEEYANTTVFNGVSCDWDEMKTVYTYPNTNYSGSNAGKIQVANFIKELGSSNNCDVSYDATGSGSSIYLARKTLRNYGYSDVSISPLLQSSSFTHNMHSKVRTQLFSGHPVYARGDRTGGHHAWVIDGYYAGYYHINWGWLNTNDGYFSAGVFNTSSRAFTASMDSKDLSSEVRNYTSGYQILTYSHN